LREFGTARFNTFSVSTIFGLYIWFIKQTKHLIQRSLLTCRSMLRHPFGVHFDKQLVHLIRFKYFIFLHCKAKPAKTSALSALVFLRRLSVDHDINHIARSSADNALREDATLVAEVGIMKRGVLVHLDGVAVGLDAEDCARAF
jgi:hypothetical protein